MCGSRYSFDQFCEFTPVAIFLGSSIVLDSVGNCWLHGIVILGDNTGKDGGCKTRSQNKKP